MLGKLLRAALALLLAPLAVGAADPPEWTRPMAPFHLIGSIDYVGSAGIAAYLIRTRAGAILIDGTLAENAAMVRGNIERLGVPIRDVRIILVSHAHFDHAGAVAALAKASGARVEAGAGDVPALESGDPPGETSYAPVRFPSIRNVHALADGERVTLGGTTLTAIATPGHTPGCTSYAMRVHEGGRPLDILFPCSVTVAGNRLVGNRAYPRIVSDFRASIARLGTLRADVVLPAHPEVADVIGRARTGRLIDPALLALIVATSRTAFEAELARQEEAARRDAPASAQPSGSSPSSAPS